jgi:hypothetical protein
MIPFIFLPPPVSNKTLPGHFPKTALRVSGKEQAIPLIFLAGWLD